MKFYADAPVLRARQMLTDALIALWCLGWFVAGYTVHQLVSALAVFGRMLESTGRELAGGLGSAAERTGGVPLIGDSLSGPLGEARDASQRLVDAGLAEQEAVYRLALALGLVVALAPVLGVLLLWLPRRWGWVREATAASQPVAGGTEDARLHLLALRAAANRPLSAVQAVGPDAVAALRGAEPAQIRALAGLELAAMGLRLPATERLHPSPRE